MTDQLTRRDVLLTGAGSLAAIALADRLDAISMPAREQPRQRTRVLRLAHLTDVHVQPERRANQGMIACLHHVQNLADKPQLILTGGDAIMDSFEADDARTQIQWDLWRSILSQECSLPIEHCIGNHDIWGWHKSRSKTTGNEPNYGKQRALDMFEIPSRYRSFDAGNSGGWRFIVLDSVQSDGGDGYRAFLDDEQFDWLERDLAAMPATTNVLILSHIPIISASAILWAKRTDRRDFSISGSLIHQDSIRLKDLFARHPNVRLCLSGHLHHVDRVDYNGVTYLCDGAVSGNWWKGRHKDTDEGYAVIDLFDDGSFERQYITYGWNAAGS